MDLSLAHTTIMRWIQHYAPNSRNAGTASLGQLDGPGASTRPTSKSKDAGPISLPCRRQRGRTVDFLLRAKQDVAAAKAFFRLAFRRWGRLPLDHARRLSGLTSRSQRGPGRTSRGNQCKIRSSKYLNNLIEQDHRSVKLRLGPMLGLNISAKPQRRSPASNLCIGSGRVSSNSVDWVPRQHGSQDLECGSRCVVQRNFPKACLARPQNVCTTTFFRNSGRRR